MNLSDIGMGMSRAVAEAIDRKCIESMMPNCFDPIPVDGTGLTIAKLVRAKEILDRDVGPCMMLEAGQQLPPGSIKQEFMGFAFYSWPQRSLAADKLVGASRK